MLSEKIIQRPRTIMEVYRMLPEGTLAEVINGNLYMSSSPTTNHQRILRRLSTTLSDWVESKKMGEIFIVPYDVYIDEQVHVVQPDIVFIPSSKSVFIQSDGFHGVPDLIVEILSPGNVRHDTEIKKELYERFGVKEYWIVNPDTKEVSGFFYDGKAYATLGSFTGKITSRLLNSTFEF